jgi:hypothetical protein
VRRAVCSVLRCAVTCLPVTASTWESRDLPVLRAIVDLSDEGTWVVQPEAIAARTALAIETVKIALWALAKEHPPFFEYSDLTTYGADLPEIGVIRDPTGHARRTVGTWPSPEDRVTQMIAALQAAAEREPDPKKKSFLRKTVEYLSSLPRDVALAIIMSNVLLGS